MKTYEDVSIQIQVLGALELLVCNTEDRVYLAGGLTCVLSKMKEYRSITEIQKYGWFVFENVLAELQEEKKNDAVMEICALEGIQLIIDALKNNPNNPGLQESGCLALGNIMGQGIIELNKEIYNSNGIKLVLNAIRYHDKHTEVIKNGCLSIANACFENIECQNIVIDLGGMELLRDIASLLLFCEDIKFEQRMDALNFVFWALHSLILENKDNENRLNSIMDPSIRELIVSVKYSKQCNKLPELIQTVLHLENQLQPTPTKHQ